MSSFITDDSGARESHESGMVRDTRGGKGRFDLTSPIVAERLAGVYERGCAKYGARNWEKGMPLSRFLDSAKRHINDYELIALYQREGIPLDQLPDHVNPDEDHLAQAIWNLNSMIHLGVTKPHLDDLTRRNEAASIIRDTEAALDALRQEVLCAGL
jgi:hypothetical protein